MLEKKIITLMVVITLLIPSFVLAAMSSTNYYIYADSIDVGGGVGTSASYDLQDSLGGYAVGISTSTSYEVRAGYQSAEVGILSLVLDNNSVDLGTLSNAGTVASANVVATVDTSSDSGYTLSISSVSGSSLTAVTDGIVNGAGGTEEYGLAVSGTHVAYVNDAAIINALVLSSFAAPASSDNTTLTFKAVRSSGSSVATYSQTITLTASANI